MPAPAEKRTLDAAALRIGSRGRLGQEARDIRVIDLRGIVSYTDYLVICSGGTERRARRSGAVYERLKHEDGLLPRRTEGEREARWILLDYLDCVLHIFTPEAREYTAWSSSGARRRAAPWIDPPARGRLPRPSRIAPRRWSCSSTWSSSSP